MIAWMAYAVGVGILITGAGWVAERALRGAGRAGRWAWAVAGAASVVVPVASRWIPDLPLPAGGGGGAGVSLGLPTSITPVEVAAGAEPWWIALGAGLDAAAGIAWVAASLTLGAGLALSWRSVRRHLAGCPEEEVDGDRVRRSDRLGPAVFGFRSPAVVLPAWIERLDVDARELVLAHEAEHVRAGDARLLAAGLAAVVAMPWNPLLWLQLHRLRLAMEVDCDARVLRRTAVDPARYGRVLLEVGRLRSGRGAPVPALGVVTERWTALERRIRALAGSGGTAGRARVAALLATAVVLGAVACLVPDPGGERTDPTEPESAEPEATRAAADRGETNDVGATPTFTPFTVAPELKNREEVVTALRRGYPDVYRQAGVGGTVTVYFHVDEGGRVVRTRLDDSSGHEALDEAALRVADVYEFTPALNRDEAVPVWISLPITFRSEGGREAPGASGTIEAREAEDPEPGEETEATFEAEEVEAVRQARELKEAPTFTPFTVAPELENREEVVEALEAEYPPLLRDAGIGGTVTVYFLVDETGRVVRTRLNRSSGHDALDRAALRVADVYEFTPALNRDETVPVWISLPITFRR